MEYNKTIEVIKKEFFEKLDYSQCKEKLNDFKGKVDEFIKKTQQSKTVSEIFRDEKNPENKEELLNLYKKLSSEESKLEDDHTELDELIKNLCEFLRTFLIKHRYNSDNSEFMKYYNEQFKEYFTKDYFKNVDKSVFKFKYPLNDRVEEKYLGQREILEEDDGKEKIKKQYREGFGYYNWRETGENDMANDAVDFSGTFEKNEIKKGFLSFKDGTVFNGEFKDDDKVGVNDRILEKFSGVYFKNQEGKPETYYILIGEFSPDEFQGVYIFRDERRIKIYIGNIIKIKDKWIKEIEDRGLVIDLEFDHSSLVNFPNYSLYYGEFYDDSPKIKDNKEPFYIYENKTFYKIEKEKKFIISNIKKDEEKHCLTQGNYSEEGINGKGGFFDRKNNFFFMGNFVKGEMSGQGRLINFEYSKDDNSIIRLIFINGTFTHDGVIKSFVCFLDAIEAESFKYLENAELNKDFNLLKGKIYFSRNEYYEGEFKDFMKHGKGKYTFADGSSYEGPWENDKKNGIGLYTDANSKKFEREWKDDVVLPYDEDEIEKKKKNNNN